MNRYELLMLTVPEITKDEVSSVESQVERLVNAVQGTILTFERWGKYRLAYPVKKNDYGVYFLARFEAENPGTLLADLRMLFKIKFNELVMRTMDTRLDENASLEYERPLSLEETPKRRVGSMFEGKGKSLLSTARSHRAESRTPAPQVEVTTQPQEAATTEKLESPVVPEGQSSSTQGDKIDG